MFRAVSRMAIAVFLLAAGAAQAAEDRNRLWPIVRTCASAYRMVGVSFPCLKVELPGGALDRGYAVLRPLRSNDLILSPTRETVGVEDPFLQSPRGAELFRRRVASPFVSQGSRRESASPR